MIASSIPSISIITLLVLLDANVQCQDFEFELLFLFLGIDNIYSFDRKHHTMHNTSRTPLRKDTRVLEIFGRIIIINPYALGFCFILSFLSGRL